MEAAWANEASSSSSISTQFKYDVFLSFSGVDTRNNFTSHLLSALERHGFHTFRDDTKLNRGEVIGDALLKAIEESKISLVILSKNYASSSWCLDELVKIMECKKNLHRIVLPIFHNVKPSNVRFQRGSLAKSFDEHERLKEISDGRVKKWREALTEVANLSGWDLPKEANGDEARLIQKVVEEVQNKLGILRLHVARHEIGLESRFQNLKLKMESEDVRIVAVWGMGGIGKTTLVKKLYNLIQHKFESSCFLANIGETWKQLNGRVVLQEQLLSDVLGAGTHNIKKIHHGIEVIKQRARRHKVLLILDDVDDVEQLTALAIDQDSLGFGSRIVVTTRDISLLNVLKEYEIYEAEKLNEDDSLELFSWHCFKEDHPTEDHLDLSRQVVHHVGGLPLALEILGSFFRGKSIPEWKSAIAKLREIPDDKIKKKLEISFDSLNKEEQDLFLDMACFFVGTSPDFTLKILEACRRYAVIGIRVLADRCLIKYDRCNKLVMHDMVRDMGREIVRQESRENPGERSRLWHGKDVLDVLRRGTGTGKVEGLLLNTKDVQVNAKPFEAPRDSMGTKAVEDVKVNAKAFEKMNNLWLLHLDYVHQTADFEHASRRLLWLSWKGFPSDCLPRNLSMEELIALDLRYSSLKNGWNEYKGLAELEDYVDIVVPTVGDVPSFFPYQGKGSNISFVVPPLVKQKLLGWVICVIFTGPEEVVGGFISNIVIYINKIEKTGLYDRYLHSFSKLTCQDQAWLRYIPQGYSGLHLQDGDEVEIEMDSDNVSLVKNLGVDLIYEVDENITKTNENQEALIQYTSAHNQNVSLPEDFSSARKRRRRI